MIRMRLSAAAAAIGARHRGADPELRGVAIDSRRVEPGALFVALPGLMHDGHDFVAHAGERGACAALVSRPGEYPLPTLEVPDATAALARLALAWRRRHHPRVLAVTGSNGKTTVKEMLAAIMRQEFRTLATRGNLNNELGVPLTLFELEPAHEILIAELGANHPGEIERLSALVRPDVGVITLCAPAHLEGFGTLEGVARAKGEIFRGMARDGVAVLNAEDAFAGLWRELAAPRRVVAFGLGEAADLHGTWRPAATGGALEIRGAGAAIEVALGLPGRHNAMNALAAAAAGLAAGASREAVQAGLAGVRPVPGRLAVHALGSGLTLIDDTYNANPSSLRAGLEVLATRPGRRWLVLGDMGELGAEEVGRHEEAADAARSCGVERLYTTGALARNASCRFGSGATHFESAGALVEALIQDLPVEATVLVKGSRAMGLERVVQALAGRSRAQDRPGFPCC